MTQYSLEKDKTLFREFFLHILSLLLHLKFPSNSQDFTTSFFIQSQQTIGKLALFEKSCDSGKEEVRTGGVMSSPILSYFIVFIQLGTIRFRATQHNALSWGS